MCLFMHKRSGTTKGKLGMTNGEPAALTSPDTGGATKRHKIGLKIALFLHVFAKCNTQAFYC